MFSGRVSARSDLYSLGLVLAAAAIGDPLPMGATVAEAVQARQQRPSIPPAIPPGLRAEIAPLLAPDPADRPATADGLFAAHPPQAEKTQSGSPRRRRLLAALAALAAAAALLLVLDLPHALQSARSDHRTDLRLRAVRFPGGGRDSAPRCLRPGAQTTPRPEARLRYRGTRLDGAGSGPSGAPTA